MLFWKWGVRRRGGRGRKKLTTFLEKKFVSQNKKHAYNKMDIFQTSKLENPIALGIGTQSNFIDALLNNHFAKQKSRGGSLPFFKVLPFRMIMFVGWCFISKIAQRHGQMAAQVSQYSCFLFSTTAVVLSSVMALNYTVVLSL